jgi:hypothetical protein
MKHVFYIFVSVIFVSCVTAKTATVDQDRDAKQFTPADGTANVYIARKNELPGSTVPFRILVDGQEIGILLPGTYQMAVLNPGQHRIEVKAGFNSARENLDTKAGKNYFWSTGSKADSAATQPELSFVLFEKMGQLMISQSRRAEIPK